MERKSAKSKAYELVARKAFTAVTEEVGKVGSGYSALDLPFHLGYKARLELIHMLTGSLRDRVIVVSGKGMEGTYITILEKRGKNRF